MHAKFSRVRSLVIVLSLLGIALTLCSESYAQQVSPYQIGHYYPDGFQFNLTFVL